MPAVSSGKVLVTGANGFIAGWIIKVLLEHGYYVRGSTRTPEKADGIRRALPEYGDRLDFLVVENIAQPGAFDNAIRDIDAIVHVASPIHLTPGCDPSEVIRPAVDGTTSILHSASAPGSSVKRIVLMSSVAAVIDRKRGDDVIFTEQDWNETDHAEVAEKGADAHPVAVYRVSKTAAEKAAWDIFESGRANGSIGWDLVTLCPPWVFGPVLGAETPKDLPYSVAEWFMRVVEEGGEPSWDTRPSWTDVRDLADATLATLVRPNAGGERFIVSTSCFTWTQWVTIARHIFGKTNTAVEITEDASPIEFDAKKSQELLGMSYRSMDETALFMIGDFKAKEWC